MKRNVFYPLAFSLVAFGAFLAVYISRPFSGGEILGVSLNRFYAEKSFNLLPPPQKKDGVSPPNINAHSAILIYEPLKYPLYAINEDAAVPIASITKVMTAIIALENYKLDEVVEVKEEAAKTIGSRVFLKEGEKMRIEDLLYALLLSSGNDAAKALALAKTTEEDFVGMMNEKAKELGLESTHFEDTAGLNDEGRSSASDVAVLFAYALRKPKFGEIISTPEKEISLADGARSFQLKSSNRLITGEISIDLDVLGGKTGFTPEAGHTLVCAAERDGARLISVILKTGAYSPTASAEESKKLLSWGFGAFEF